MGDRFFLLKGSEEEFVEVGGLVMGEEEGEG